MIETKFKNTEIGLIPEDWEVFLFSKSFKDLRNNTFSRDMLNDDKGIIKNVHYGDVLIKFGEVLDFNKEQVPFITDSSSYSSYDALADGDIIMADTAEDETVGKVCEILNIGDNIAVSGLHTIALRPLVKCAPMFLGYYLNSKNYHNQLLPLIQGTKVSSISKTPLKETYIVLPPLPEQRRIAEVLSEADELIKQWENVIAKKRDIKTATMQLLLTGKKRLNGFKDEWVEKKFEEIFVHISSRGKQLDTKDYLNLGKYPIVDQGQTEIVGYTDAQNPVVCPQNGIIIFGDHTRIFKYVDYDFYVGADGTQLLTTRDDYSCLYLYYSCLTLDIPNTGYNRHFKYLKDAIFFIPPTLSEQRAIAEILSDMDEEIKTLEAKVEKLRNIKSGMMQQLLSGKIRLKGEEGDNVRQFVENNFGQMPYAAEDEAEFGL